MASKPNGPAVTPLKTVKHAQTVDRKTRRRLETEKVARTDR